MLGSLGLMPVSLGLAGLLVDAHASLVFFGAAGSILAATLAAAATRTVRDLR